MMVQLISLLVILWAIIIGIGLGLFYQVVIIITIITKRIRIRNNQYSKYY